MPSSKKQRRGKAAIQTAPPPPPPPPQQQQLNAPATTERDDESPNSHTSVTWVMDPPQQSQPQQHQPTCILQAQQQLQDDDQGSGDGGVCYTVFRTSAAFSVVVCVLILILAPDYAATVLLPVVQDERAAALKVTLAQLTKFTYNPETGHVHEMLPYMLTWLMEEWQTTEQNITTYSDNVREVVSFTDTAWWPRERAVLLRQHCLEVRRLLPTVLPIVKESSSLSLCGFPLEEIRNAIVLALLHARHSELVDFHLGYEKVATELRNGLLHKSSTT